MDPLVKELCSNGIRFRRNDRMTKRHGSLDDAAGQKHPQEKLADSSFYEENIPKQPTK